MARQIRLVFPTLNIEVVATLLEDQAPATWDAFWDILASPLEAKLRVDHDFGAKLCLAMPPVPGLPPESSTHFPIPGDLLFYHYAGRLPRGEKTYELGIYWRRGGKGFVDAGWIAGNLFATVTDNLAGLQKAATEVLNSGPKPVRLERDDESRRTGQGEKL
jgi:hypothetical protein